MATSSTPDYRLDGFTAVNEEVADYFFRVTLDEHSFVPMADHHTADGRDSYLLYHDPTYIYDVPGTASFVAVHLTRDIEQRTYQFALEKHPLAPLAQHWLINRGCPPEGIELSNPNGPRPADALTARLEDRLRANPEGRYEVIDHYTGEPGDFDTGMETWVIVHDTHPDSAGTPYRVFLEEIAPSLRTYTLREGAFPTAEAAGDWTWNTDRPLPPAPEPLTARSEAARSRSPHAPTRLAVPPAPVIPPRSVVKAGAVPARRGLS
ncbi:hypothetical protein [Streptomyces sp. NPDC059816]|uniref:hypothetical protein n=1 Tax=Streptomyces sp. NPDC059816 TaxID=3346960 RepID=UPI00364B4344